MPKRDHRTMTNRFFKEQCLDGKETPIDTFRVVPRGHSRHLPMLFFSLYLIGNSLWTLIIGDWQNVLLSIFAIFVGSTFLSLIVGYYFGKFITIYPSGISYRNILGHVGSIRWEDIAEAKLPNWINYYLQLASKQSGKTLWMDYPVEDPKRFRQRIIMAAGADNPLAQALSSQKVLPKTVISEKVSSK